MESSHPRWPLLVLLALVLAFENFWMWPDSDLIAGVPVNLGYHLLLCCVAALLLAGVVRRGWPRNSDED